jgi:hypothetical protein
MKTEFSQDSHNTIKMIRNALVGGLAVMGLGLMLSGCEPANDEPELPESTAPSAEAAGSGQGPNQATNATGGSRPVPTEPAYSYRSDGSLDYESARLWTDAQGRTLEAQLRDFDAETVQLRDRAGQVKEIARIHLSPADNRWLDDVKAALPQFELAEDAPREYTVIDTIDGQFYTKVTVEEYGNVGVTVNSPTRGQVHLAYDVLNKSHLRKIGYPLEELESEPMAANR